MWVGIAAHVAQLIYYCSLFRVCFNEGLHRLEESYDEDMRGSLRLVKHCFLGALAVGISALVYVVFRLGHIWYEAFTFIYTIYYIYLVICVINYRIGAGYIVKVIAAPSAAPAPAPAPAPTPVAVAEDTEAERLLADAIARWVEEKQYVRNDLTVEEIALELGTTHMLLKRYFTTRIGTPFRTWRLDLRLNEAMRILREEDIPSSGVHTLVGIADKSNFHKLFRKQTGMTPQEYKDSHRS